MKNKKIFIVLALLAIVFIGASQASAADIIFKPSVTIPGAGDVPGGFALGTEYKITGDSIAQYIYLIYVYGSRFAAVLAMFMLVIAGWQWVMAGGVPERINRSKDIIIGVFVGLALLFGGNVLMSQISSKLVTFDTLDINPLTPLKLVDGNSCCALRETRDPIGDPSNFLATLRPAYTSSTVSCAEALGTPILPPGYNVDDYHWQTYDGIEACQKAATLCEPASVGCRNDGECSNNDRKCRNIGPAGLTPFNCCVDL